MCVTKSNEAINQTLVDVRRNVQLERWPSSGDEYFPKIRKAYTITKQRERWTEEEHNKFIEALKLHGRAWRRIEEHVGSKTAVQIRSHAQKFFSKVTRESSCYRATSVKSIVEIPPPRPKKKPTHPYPRKLGNASIRILPSAFTHPLVSDAGIRSPTSVLTNAGSDTLASPASNISKHCGSLGSSSCTSGGTSPATEQEEQAFRFEEGNASSQSGFTSPTMTTSEEKSDMEPEEAPATSLRLFGRTVVVPDKCKPSGEKEENPTTQTEKDLQPWAPIQNKEDDTCVTIPSEGACNSWSYGLPSLVCLPSQNEQINTIQSTTAASCTPWFPFIPMLPFFPVSGCESDAKKKESAEEPPIELCETFSSPTNNKRKLVKGFVPYKRCSIAA